MKKEAEVGEDCKLCERRQQTGLWSSVDLSSVTYQLCGHGQVT